MPQATLRRAAASGADAACFNGGNVISITPAGYPVGLTMLNLGGGVTGVGVGAWWYITRIAAWLNHQASNAALQALTT